MRAKERFEHLYRAHSDAVFRYALRRTTQAEAADVHSEVFLAAWRRLDELPHEPRAWLLGTSRRVLANRRRGDRRQRAVAERLALMPVAEPGEQPGAGRLRDAMGSLSEGDRELLSLIAWEQLSPAEAAEVLGCRASTFRVRLHRARARLAAALAAVEHRAPSAADLTTTQQLTR